MRKPDVGTIIGICVCVGFIACWCGFIWSLCRPGLSIGESLVAEVVFLVLGGLLILASRNAGVPVRIIE